MSRTEAAARNSRYVIVQRAVSVVLAFVSRTVFIYALGLSYLGANGLFTSVIAILSFGELGLGSAITVSLYKPLAEGDKETTRSLVQLYRRVYVWLGLLVSVVGVLLVPVLPKIINGYDSLGIPNLEYIYLLVIANTAVSYLGSSRRALLTADQKEYVNVRNELLFKSMSQVVQIVVLLLWHNFVVYLWVAIVFTLLSNIAIWRTAGRLYPYIREHPAESLPRETRKRVISLAGAGLSHKVGQAVITSTDNIVLSALVGVGAVGIYSNYLLIVNTIDVTVSTILTSLVASVGNLHATADKEDAERVFLRLYYVCRWLYVTVSVVLISVLNRFIVIWTGGVNVFTLGSVALIVANFYIYGMRRIVSVFLLASGLHYETRFRPLWEAVVNLAVSLVGARLIGVPGVFLGTFVAYLTGSVWYDPHVLFRHWFAKSARTFLLVSLRDFIVTVVLSASLYAVSDSVFPDTVLGLLFTGIFVLVTTIGALYVLYGRDPNFQYFGKLLRNAVGVRSGAATE